MIVLFYSGTLGDNITAIFEDIRKKVWYMAIVYVIYVFLTMSAKASCCSSAALPFERKQMHFRAYNSN